MEQPDWQQHFKEHGWAVVPSVVEQDKIQLCKDSLVQEALDMVFEGQLDPSHACTEADLTLFTDPRERERRLSNPKCVWNGGFSRDPILSKSSGQINIHYNGMVQQHITFSSAVYSTLSEAYGKEQLVYTQGPDRVCIKPKGGDALKQHMDCNVVHWHNNFDERIQAFCCISQPTDVPVKQSGCLRVQDGFHLLYEFAHHLFQKGGLCPVDVSDSRFLQLPREWDKRCIKELKRCAGLYSRFLSGERQGMDQKELEFFKRVESGGVSVPEQIPPLDWVEVVCKPGDIVVWDQRLPHATCPNKSDTPRIVVYISLFPVEREWYESEESRWCLLQFLSGASYYSTNPRQYPTVPRNKQEMQYRDQHGWWLEHLHLERALQLIGWSSWYIQ